MDKPIRVLVANRPRLMRKLILTTFTNQPDSVHYWASLNIHSHDVEASEEAILGVLRTKGGSICGMT